jgi:hypothetical protein
MSSTLSTSIGQISQPALCGGRRLVCLNKFKLNEVLEMKPTTTVTLTADADPTLLVRVGALLCTLGLIPNRLTVTRPINELLCMSIEISDTTARDIDLLRRKIMQLPQYIDMALKCVPCTTATQTHHA